MCYGRFFRVCHVPDFRNINGTVLCLVLLGEQFGHIFKIVCEKSCHMLESEIGQANINHQQRQ
jgi:hypothetical protein